LIGHTQPRRIAARSVAARIAAELGTTVGGQVGYKVRFSDRTGPEALIKLMTDGILLAETQERPPAGSVRGHHPRRSPRAQPEHRFPAGLSEAAAAAPARSQADYHLGDHRPDALFPPFQRRADHRSVRRTYPVAKFAIGHCSR
jgi:hypothetical protein